MRIQSAFEEAGIRFLDNDAGGGIAPDTVTNLEIGRYAGDPETLAIIEQVLMKAGIDFIEENGGGPGVRLRRPPQGKQRK